MASSVGRYAVSEERRDSDFMKKSLDYLGVKQVAGPYKWFNLAAVLPRSMGANLFRPSDGNRVYNTHLQDKYLLLCLVSLPLPPNVDKELKKIFKLYPRLVSCAGGAFEMVFVANTRNQDDFNNFFTPDFPGVTLPFADPHTGLVLDKIRSSLGLTPTKPEHDPLVGLILDPTCMVLQEDYCGRCFAEFGASFFPFTYERVKELVDTEEAIRARSSFPYTDNPSLKKSVSLADLLCCEPSRVLYRIGGGGDKITVDELSRKDCVGVYICADGRFMSKLASLYNEFHKVGEDGSKSEGEFEIVMVRLRNVHSDKAIARIKPELRNASSWWEFPYNKETTLRLKRVHPRGCEEVLNIVRPAGKFWDFSAKAVLCSRDGLASYPFTMESFLERMTSVTVDSLLGGNSQTLVKISNTYDNRYKNKYTVGSRLQGENVFVHFDHPGSLNTGVWKDIRDAYYKTDDCDFEVVFVPLGTTSYDDPELKSCIREMPSSWFMLLPQFLNTLRLYTTEAYSACTVAFGNDGQIRTKYSGFYMDQPGGIATLFAHDLHPVEVDRMLYDIERHFDQIIRTLEYEYDY